MDLCKQFEWYRRGEDPDPDPEWLQDGKPTDGGSQDGVPQAGGSRDGGLQDEGQAGKNVTFEAQEAGFDFDERVMQNVAYESHDTGFDAKAFVSSAEALLMSDDGELEVINGGTGRGRSGPVVEEGLVPSFGWHTVEEVIRVDAADPSLWHDMTYSATTEAVKILEELTELKSGSGRDRIRKGIEKIDKMSRKLNDQADSLENMISNSVLPQQTSNDLRNVANGLRVLSRNFGRVAKDISSGEQSLAKLCQSCASRANLRVKDVLDACKTSFVSVRAFITTLFKDGEDDPFEKIVHESFSAGPGSSSSPPLPGSITRPDLQAG